MSRTAAGALLGTIGMLLVAGSVEMARCPQLVAFVPKQNELAMTPTRQQQLAALLAREDAEAKLTLPAGYGAVQAKATMPISHHALRQVTAKPVSRAKVPAAEERIANADQQGDRVVTSDGRQWIVLGAWAEVQTVASQPDTQAPRSSAHSTFRDYDLNAAAPAQGESSSIAAGANGASPVRAQAGKASNQSASPTHQLTVTQLILRVVPANQNANDPNAKSTQSPAGSLRGGWFVIQL